MARRTKAESDLLELLASAETVDEVALLIEDLLTPQERASVAERWQLIQELEKGTTQRDISKKLNLSIAKVTRGSRALRYGKGGFRYFLEKLGKSRLS